jgi:hypothetical protein
VLPHWLEWLLALIVGFLVMEAVRYWFNHRKYTALLSGLQPEQVTERDSQARDRLGATEQRADGDAAQEAPPTSR